MRESANPQRCIATALALLFGGCEPSSTVVTPRAPVTGKLASGVEGTVSLGPMCPVVRSDDPCPDQPFSATLAIHDGDGSMLLQAQSDAIGRYRVALAPGEYTLVPLTPGQGMLPFASPVEFTVRDGEWVRADIGYDSGIR